MLQQMLLLYSQVSSTVSVDPASVGRSNRNSLLEFSGGGQIALRRNETVGRSRINVEPIGETFLR